MEAKRAPSWPPPAIARPLVLAWGNPLRGDDGFGPAVGERLARQWPGLAEVVCCLQLVPELAERVAACPACVMVDATTLAPAGRLVEHTSDQLERLPPEPAAITHHLGPRLLIEMAWSLYGRSPPALLLGVGVGSCQYGFELTPPVAEAVPRAAARIAQWLECFGPGAR